MIEIKHKETGKVLVQVNSHTLQGVDLSDKNLSGADLRGALLCTTNLIRSDLTDADLYDSNLCGAYLDKANLRDANISNATLIEVNLRDTTLAGANLTGSDLNQAVLSRADLTMTNFSQAFCLGTHFAGLQTLHLAKGLETITHIGGSSLDIVTLRNCVNELPDAFLRGVGYNDEEIETLRAMYKPGGIQYYSCFLSHAAGDGVFVDRLRESLLAKNVTCWHYQYDARGGRTLPSQINQAIKAHDKLVLVCSKNSLLRENVVLEIIAAIEREKKFGERKLFLIRLDDYLFSDELTEYAERMTRHGEWKMNWVSWVRDVFAPDFRNWTEHDSYQAALKNLLRDLKQSPQ